MPQEWVKKTVEISRDLSDRFRESIPRGRTQADVIRELMETYVAHRRAETRATSHSTGHANA